MKRATKKQAPLPAPFLTEWKCLGFVNGMSVSSGPHGTKAEIQFAGVAGEQPAELINCILPCSPDLRNAIQSGMTLEITVKAFV